VAVLDGYRPADATEAADAERMRAIGGNPWGRQTPLHFTASALIVHEETGRVLLRWHTRQRDWLQVGGHGDPGEWDPIAIALREAEEETGLTDLEPWPDAALRHVVIVKVHPGKGEPAHEHADLRYFLATRNPDAARPETPDAPLHWLGIDEAVALTSNDNLRVTLGRLAVLLRPDDRRPAR
jgi:8-oxo-dGTP pyrophosphatase MutT (NUDIX family)